MAGSFASFKKVADQLPFDVGNFERASRAFEHWHERRQPDDERVVDLWTYCYVRRYFTIKFAKRAAESAADLDDLVARAYRKIDGARADLDEPDRYAAWVSVICQNTYRNYLRRGREYVSVEDEEEETGEDEAALQADAPPAGSGDAERALRAVHAAIERLPDYLAEAARLRLLEEKSYDEISEATGKSKASMRTYVNRARKKLQEDEYLSAFRDVPEVS
jgi:RNA polymerase sigma factor (sigma-70 family)